MVEEDDEVGDGGAEEEQREAVLPVVLPQDVPQRLERRRPIYPYRQHKKN